ncbi:MAG TPA: alpha/beta hydrolase [Herbaspirillum sp.]|nr:alpha/beta hydrolase [Herbaspirillum sp.]
MQRTIKIWLFWLLLIVFSNAYSQTPAQVVDLQTRPGVTQRMLVLSPPDPKATVILFSGGDGGLAIQSDGSLRRGNGNFLVRSRQLFADQGFLVEVVDAPSDRQGGFFLEGFRQTPEHVTDIKAAIAWARDHAKAPVWLVGTSRGTQSAAYVATELTGADGPDGLVLTSTILSDPRGRPVTAMPLDRLHIPVIVAHHKDDACRLCSYSQLPQLMDRLTNVPRKQLLTFTGGQSRGDPCEAFAHHGYNGIESDVVNQISAAILQK